MQFTQRQRPFSGRWRSILAAIPVGLLLGFLGPFGSNPAYPTEIRYAFWLGLTVAGVVAAVAADAVLPLTRFRAGAVRIGDTAPAFATLFVTGMLIFPLGALVCRFAFKRRAPDGANPMGRIGLESTIPMIAGLVVAWLMLPLRPEWVFPIAAIAVGTHFFAFRSAYGDATYWLLGALLTTLGALELFGVTQMGTSLLYLFAAIEITIGLWLIRRELMPSRLPLSPPQ